MKVLFTLCLLSITLSFSVFSQGSKKDKGPTVSVSTTINYYPALEPYEAFSSFLIEDEDLILTFLTANSGTFVLEPGQPLYIERTNVNQIPAQYLGVGTSVQIKNQNLLFHEISLTKLSVVKAYNEVEFATVDSSNNKVKLQGYGYEHRAAAFGFRYELGKYFGKNKSKVRFGLSGGLEPSLYFYKKTPKSIQDFPVNARIVTVELSVIPMLSFMLSKKVSLDFKAIPNMLLGDFGSFIEKNPALTKRQQKLDKEYSLPELNMAFSILLRYNIKEPKK